MSDDRKSASMNDEARNDGALNDEALKDAAGGVYSYESLRKTQIGLDPETKKEARGYLNTGLKVLSPAYGLASLLNKD